MISQPYDPFSDALRWALEDSGDASMAAADWLARDVDPNRRGAIELVTDPETSLESLKAAKQAFKTMRIVGETSSDRRLAARLYLGTIASAMLNHDRRISSQSEEAIVRNLTALADDGDMPLPLRRLAMNTLWKMGCYDAQRDDFRR